jgi:succinate dehydrogenase / fumarate reductase flavoprotein subunit
MQSERAQSVMAEGGINACLNTMDEDDAVENHIEDTIRGGVNLADKIAVRGLCENAPKIVKNFYNLGVPFQTNENGIVQRNFGGQKKKRTAFVKSSTGKMLMTALIDAARRYEAEGIIKRYPHHVLQALHIQDDKCKGATVSDTHTGESISFFGSVILASGGMNGLFDGLTTGTTQNTADVTAMCLENGVELANLEFIQYHPTTIAIPGERLLISEAARGEGGRLFVVKNGAPWYFMEEKYPELKNLMPRDVVSAEMVAVTSMPECENQVYLDMTALDKSVWKTVWSLLIWNSSSITPPRSVSRASAC